MKVEQKLSIIFLNIGPANKGNKMPQLSPYTPISTYKLCLGSPGCGAEKAADIPDTAAAADTCPGHGARGAGGGWSRAGLYLVSQLSVARAVPAGGLTAC